MGGDNLCCGQDHLSCAPVSGSRRSRNGPHPTRPREGNTVENSTTATQRDPSQALDLPVATLPAPPPFCAMGGRLGGAHNSCTAVAAAFRLPRTAAAP